MSDSLALNKAMAAVLVCGIAFMMSGLVADGLVHPKRLAQTAIKIDVKEAPAASAGPAEAPLTPIAPLLAKADPAAGGADMAKQCAVCHDWTKGGPAKVGPNLYGVVGGPHAHMPGFTYSAGLTAIKGPWTFDELNQWLRNPRSVVPGTRMSFAGISSDQERANVIDYLHTLSDQPEPLPAATPASADATKPAAPATPATNGVLKPGAVVTGNPAGH